MPIGDINMTTTTETSVQPGGTQVGGIPQPLWPAGTAPSGVHILIPGDIARACEAAYKKAHDAYYKKGGIAELKEKLKEAQEGDTSVGNLLLNVGRLCLTHVGNDHKAAASLFKGACAQVEDKARRDQEDTTGKKPTMQQLLPTWAPSKTVVMAALEKGFALNDKDPANNELRYPGIGAVRTAVRNSRTPQSGGRTGSGTQGAALPAFKSERLKISIDGLFKNLIVLTEVDQDMAAEVIMQAVTVIAGKRTDATPAAEKQEAQQQAHDHAKEAAEKEAHQAAAAEHRNKREQRKRGGSRGG